MKRLHHRCPRICVAHAAAALGIVLPATIESFPFQALFVMYEGETQPAVWFSDN